MLHPKITDQNLREQIKKSVLESHGKYIEPNHIDNFCLVVVPEILDKLMNVVMIMTFEELDEGGWWIKGFPKRGLTSSHCLQHSDLTAYAKDIAKEIYHETKSSESSGVSSGNT